MSSFAPNNADDIAIATIRTLAVDAVAKANSGHPGPHILMSLSLILLNGHQARRWVWPPSPTSFFRGTYNFGSSFFETDLIDRCQIRQRQPQELKVVQPRSICFI